MKVTAILKGKIDTNGHQPIQIRIADGSKRIFVPTHIKVSPSLFEKGRVKKSHPYHRDLNSKIDAKIIQLQAQALNGFEKKERKIEFFTYVNSKIAHLTREPGTLRQYNSQLKKLKSFRPTIYLQDLNHDFFNQYKKHLISKGNKGNTLWSSFKFLKTFVNSALDDSLLQKNPFLKWEFPEYTSPLPTYLDDKDIAKIVKFRDSKACTGQLYEIVTWFLIAINTGFRISDIKQFDRHKRIVNKRIVFKTQKTGQIVGLGISKKLEGYFKDVNYQPLSVHENTYNKSLKLLAVQAGIKKRITSHVARHTTGMLLAEAEVSIEAAAEILGHSSPKYTEVYYKITNKRIDRELRKLK